MGARTTIEWTQADDGTAGASWNPVTGCTKLSPTSPGCANCYAQTFAERFRGTPGHYFEHGFDLQLRPDKLDEPLRWRRPRRVFLSSMSDIFHPGIPDDYLASIFAVMAIGDRHTFLVLTKRHARMRSLLRSSDFRDQVAEAITDRMAATSAPGRHWPVRLDRTTDDGLNIWGPTTWPLPNVALGVSAENQHWADIRLNALYDTPAAIRFLSAEPLLGAITLRGATPAQLDWVIVGGESGHHARPMHPAWARALRDETHRAGIAFTFKQWGTWGLTPRKPTAQPHYLALDGTLYAPGDIAYPDGPRYDDALRADHQRGLHTVYRATKSHHGRELDGRIHDAHPHRPLQEAVQ